MPREFITKPNGDRVFKPPSGSKGSNGYAKLKRRLELPATAEEREAMARAIETAIDMIPRPDGREDDLLRDAAAELRKGGGD